MVLSSHISPTIVAIISAVLCIVTISGYAQDVDTKVLHDPLRSLSEDCQYAMGQLDTRRNDEGVTCSFLDALYEIIETQDGACSNYYFVEPSTYTLLRTRICENAVHYNCGDSYGCRDAFLF